MSRQIRTRAPSRFAGQRATRRFIRKKPVVRRRQLRTFIPRTMGAMSQTEMKYFTSFLTTTAIATGTSWTVSDMDPSPGDCLFFPVEGSDVDNRIGRRVNVVRLQIRGVLIVPTDQDAPDVLSNPSVRVILYIDQQTNAAQSTGDQVMEQYQVSVPGVFTGFQNVANFGRFRVLRDKIYRGNTVTAGTDGASTLSICAATIPFKISVRFPGTLPVKFNATNGGSVADIVDNSFHLLAHCSSANYGVQMMYTCRTYFKDL